MSKCKYCNQEIYNFDNEGDIDVCVDCIMENSKKLTLSLCVGFATGICFTLSFIQLIFIICNLNVILNQGFIYILPPLIACIIFGSLSIISIVVFKSKRITFS